MCTHLHVDHVGWNTKLEDGRWVPTFPNASYLFGEIEYRHWEAEYKNLDFMREVFADSVLPIMEAGKATLIGADYEIDTGLTIEPSPGHTPGHISLNVNSGGQHAVFSGDLMHHPLQVPEPSSPACSAAMPSSRDGPGLPSSSAMPTAIRSSFRRISPDARPGGSRTTAASRGSTSAMTEKLRVGVAGLGAVGLPVVRALAKGVDGLRLVAVSSRDLDRARARIAGIAPDVAVVPAAALPERAEVIVECVPKEAFPEIADPAVAAGKILVTVSGAALLVHPDIVDRARRTGARIVLATGALLGLDAVRAAAEGEIQAVRMITRKPPKSLRGAPYLAGQRDFDRGPFRARSRSSKAPRARARPGSRPTSTSPRRWAWPASGRTGRGWKSGPIRRWTATPMRSSSRPTAPG